MKQNAKSQEWLKEWRETRMKRPSLLIVFCAFSLYEGWFWWKSSIWFSYWWWWWLCSDKNAASAEFVTALCACYLLPSRSQAFPICCTQYQMLTGVTVMIIFAQKSLGMIVKLLCRDRIAITINNREYFEKNHNCSWE